MVHEDVLASQSQRLKDIIDAFTAAEPKPGREIPLDNWDADTVGRFVEYIYTGDYQSPDPVLPSTPVMTPEGSNQSAASSDGLSPVDVISVPSALGKVEEGHTLVPPVRPLTPLSECFPGGPDPLRKPSAAETFAAKYFDPSEHDFEEVFLAHAKIFALAWEFDVEALQKLSVQRLLRTFINIDSFQSDWPVASNFVELARYAYCGNNPADNGLRKIVSQFAALNFTALQTDEMKVLIEQSGGFARDLTAKVCRRLIIAEKDRDHEQKEREGLKLRLRSTRTELKEEREKSVGLGGMIEKVVERKAPPSRPSNPLADRRPFKNAVSVVGDTLFTLAPALPDIGAAVDIPPPPPKGIISGANTATTNIFGHVPVVDPSPQLLVKIPTGGSVAWTTSSQPGSKSIFESGGLFTGSVTKSLFDTEKTPTKAKTSGSYGLFFTPPMSRSTSALAPTTQTPEMGNSLDPVKQPTPSPSFFGRPSISTSAFGGFGPIESSANLFGPRPTPAFGGVKQTEISGGVFGNAPQPRSTSPFPTFGSSKPTEMSGSVFGNAPQPRNTSPFATFASARPAPGSLFGGGSGGAKTTPTISGGGFFGNNLVVLPGDMFKK